MIRLLAVLTCIIVPAAGLAQQSNRQDDDITYKYEVRGIATNDPNDRTWDYQLHDNESECTERIKMLMHDYWHKDGLMSGGTVKPVGLYIQKWEVKNGVPTGTGRRIETAEIELERVDRPGSPTGEPRGDSAPAAPVDPNTVWVVQVSDLVNGEWVPRRAGRWEYNADQEQVARETFTRIEKAIKGARKEGVWKVELSGFNRDALSRTTVQLQDLPWVDTGPAANSDGLASTASRKVKVADLAGDWGRYVEKDGVKEFDRDFTIGADGTASAWGYFSNGGKGTVKQRGASFEVIVNGTWGPFANKPYLKWQVTYRDGKLVGKSWYRENYFDEIRNWKGGDYEVTFERRADRP